MGSGIKIEINVLTLAIRNMIKMDVQSEKIRLIEWLVGLQDITILQKVAEVRDQSVDKVLPQISIEQLQSRALESEEAIKHGEFTTFGDLKKEVEAW